MNFNFCNGSRSPHGNEILFSAQMPDFDHHSCRDRLLQPDLVAGRQEDPLRPPSRKRRADLYIAQADGGLCRVTDTPTIDEYAGDWGTHALTP